MPANIGRYKMVIDGPHVFFYFDNDLVKVKRFTNNIQNIYSIRLYLNNAYQVRCLHEVQ